MDNIINEWDTANLPIVFYQYNQDLYKNIEIVVNNLYNKNHYIVIEYVFKIFDKKDMKKLIKLYNYNEIIEGLKFLIHNILDCKYNEAKISNDFKLFEKLVY